MPSVSLKDIVVTYPGARRPDQRRLRVFLHEKTRALLSRRPLVSQRLQALKGVSLDIGAGQVAGIIGENGAGKTTLLRVMSGLMVPDSGLVQVSGSVSTVFNLGAGFIPDLTGRENIHLVGSLHGFSREVIETLEEAIADFSELDEAIDRPVKTYSTGMKSRLGFSIVAFLDTEIIVLDEALSAGDYRFREKAGNLIDRFADEKKILVVVSHSPRVIRDHCTVAYYLRRGVISSHGNPDEVCRIYAEDSNTGPRLSIS